jgi:hypothetical protein
MVGRTGCCSRLGGEGGVAVLSFSTILVELGSCHQTCMTYTNAECTVENS